MAINSLQARTMCADCGKRRLVETVVEKTTNIQYEGKMYEVHVPNLIVLKCTNCGTIYLDNRADEQYRRTLRDLLGLLQPEEIKSNRIRLKLHQEQLAANLNIAAESLSRWENGHVIQSQSHNLLLRTYFTMPAFRACVTKLEQSSISVQAIWEGMMSEDQIMLLQSNYVDTTDSAGTDSEMALAA